MPLMITAFHVLAQENGDRYLFDPTECTIMEKDMCCSYEGFIRYPHVPETEVMKAFIKAQNNRRIDSLFRGAELPAMFWAVFESGEFERVAEYRRFEMRYLLDRLEEWLDETGIPHWCAPDDDRLKESQPPAVSRPDAISFITDKIHKQTGGILNVNGRTYRKHCKDTEPLSGGS